MHSMFTVYFRYLWGLSPQPLSDFDYFIHCSRRKLSLVGVRPEVVPGFMFQRPLQIGSKPSRSIGIRHEEPISLIVSMIAGVGLTGRNS
eukprot:scaffold4510_cov183-Amphora_coffeaeformis.AAC.103